MASGSPPLAGDRLLDLAHVSAESLKFAQNLALEGHAANVSAGQPQQLVNVAIEDAGQLGNDLITRRPVLAILQPRQIP